MADAGNFTVRKISPAGVVTTLAGLDGTQGNADGTGPAARFSKLSSIAVDTTGSVVVVDADVLRKISPTGAVSTLPVSLARGNLVYVFPKLAFDAGGNLFITLGNQVLKVAPDGTSSVFATVTYVPGGCFGRQPVLWGIAVSPEGVVYAADNVGQVIRSFSPSGVMSVVAGDFCVAGTQDGVGNQARFAQPTSLALDKAGNLYAADSRPPEGFYQPVSPVVAVRKITPAGVVTTVEKDFKGLAGLAVSEQGVLFISDTANARILQKRPDEPTAVYAGPGEGAVNLLLNMSTDPQGNIYTLQIPTAAFNADGTRNSSLGPALSMVKVSPLGSATVLARGLGGFWLNRGGVAADSAGNVYSTRAAIDPQRPTFVAEMGGDVIKVVPSDTLPSGTVSTLWSTADFVPARLAVDGSGTVYVAGYNNGKTAGNLPPVATPYVVKLSPTGQVLGQLPLLTGGQVAPDYRFTPELALDASGNLYVAAYNTIRKFSPTGVMTVLAGASGVAGSADGTTDQARFGTISGLALDAAGNIYAADATHATVRKITPAGVVTTVVGKAGSLGITLGELPASLTTPNGLAIDASGFLYISAGQALLRVKLPQ